MNDIINLSRRQFLKSSLLAGGGLILGAYLGKGEPSANAQRPERPVAPVALNAFVRIGADDTVTIIINHSEMGQGSMTSLAMMIAEELDADWSKVRAEHAPIDPVYGSGGGANQMTVGSSSTYTEYDRLRRVGATGRAMLIAAAAQVWNVETATCTTENSRVLHAATNRQMTFGQLVEQAARLTPPRQVTLKDARNFRLIGHATKRLDAPEKSNGAGVFGMDVNLPAMLVALVARAPVIGARVTRFNADAAKAIPGVRHVLQVDGGVAVVADGFWAAKNGRAALEVEWNEGPLASLDSDTQRAEYAALADAPGVVATRRGDAAGALGQATRRLDAVYELPYLAHATMEPLNCVADVRTDGCDVWTGSQSQTSDRNVAAQVAGLRPNQVNLHTTLLGGGFGRRAVRDGHFVRDAVQLSRTLHVPVKVIWTREDDMRGGLYRPRSYHKLSAGLSADGNLVAWQHRIVCQTLGGGGPAGAARVDNSSVQGASDIPYAIPNLLVDYKQPPGGVTTHFWRSVGHSHNAFVVESFLDEMAHAANKDPYEMRRALLGNNHARHLATLELAATRAGWGTPLPAGHARGIAFHEAMRSFVAQVAEVSVTPAGEVKVHRVVCAVDCGLAVNPEGVRAQMEGAIVFGLSAALHGEITFANGRAVQGNYDTYPVLRMDESPAIEVHIVPSTDRMGGCGEPGVPPTAPAVCNAIFAATGKRVRRLPIRAADLVEG